MSLDPHFFDKLPPTREIDHRVEFSHQKKGLMTNSVNEEKNNSIQQTYDTFSQAASVYIGSNQADKALEAFKKIVELDSSQLSTDAQSQIHYVQGSVKQSEALAEEKFETA